MDSQLSLPFKMGQEAESKSHIGGFRGAWFRCKIKDINVRKGEFWCALEYFDFPDEKISWTKVYQKDPADKSFQHQKKKMQLMMRPRFPCFYRECDQPDAQIISGMIAIINDEWEVGNLVDWWSDGCFWSGRIAAILDNDMVQVDLPKPPIGEGGSYQADRKDLRPTLLWSIEDGWRVPFCEDQRNFKSCVHLGLPLKRDLRPSLHVNIQALERKSSWKSLVLGDSNSDAKVRAEGKHMYEEEAKGRCSSPDLEDKCTDTLTKKDATSGDQLQSTHGRLSELIQLLSETDGGKKLVCEAGSNLRVSRMECHPTITLRSEALPRNALHNNCQVAKLHMDESNQNAGLSQCYGLGFSYEGCHVHKTGLDSAVTGQHVIVSGREDAATGIDLAGNDYHQPMMNDAPSTTRRNAFSISTHKKELARIILDRAKSFHNGRGCLKRKYTSAGNNFSFFVDSGVDVPSRKLGKSCIGTNTDIHGTSFSVLTHPQPQVNRDAFSIDFIGKSKLEESPVGNTDFKSDLSRLTGQIESHLQEHNGTENSVSFQVSQSGFQWDGLMEVTALKNAVDREAIEGRTCLKGIEMGVSREDTQIERIICRNEYLNAGMKSNDQVKHNDEKSFKEDAAAQGLLSSRMGTHEHGSRNRGTCMDVDTIESSVMALEELANKVRWLRGIIQFGFKQWSVITGATWQFAENQNSSKGARGF